MEDEIDVLRAIYGDEGFQLSTNDIGETLLRFEIQPENVSRCSVSARTDIAKAPSYGIFPHLGAASSQILPSSLAQTRLCQEPWSF